MVDKSYCESIRNAKWLVHKKSTTTTIHQKITPMLGLFFAQLWAVELPTFQAIDGYVNQSIQEGPKAITGAVTEKEVFLKWNIPFVKVTNAEFNSVISQYPGLKGYGGAIYIEHGEFSCDGAKFSKCFSKVAGAVAVFDCSTNLGTTSFTECKSHVMAGALLIGGCEIFQYDAHADKGNSVFNFLNVYKCSFQYCSSALSGALTVTRVAECFITETSVTNCVAYSDCGSLLLHDSNLVVNNCNFVGNRINLANIKDRNKENFAIWIKYQLTSELSGSLSLGDTINISYWRSQVEEILSPMTLSLTDAELSEIINTIAEQCPPDPLNWYNGTLRGTNTNMPYPRYFEETRDPSEPRADNILVITSGNNSEYSSDLISQNNMYRGYVAYEKKDNCALYYQDIIFSGTGIRIHSSGDTFTSNHSIPEGRGMVLAATPSLTIALDECMIVDTSTKGTGSGSLVTEERSYPAQSTPPWIVTEPARTNPTSIKKLTYHPTLPKKHTTLTATPTDIFTPSNIFSRSKDFTVSKAFSSSIKFTASKPFSASGKFTNSGKFTASKPFSASGKFTNSGKFTASKPLSASDKFMASSKFTASKQLSASDKFTASKQLSASGKFTLSNVFSSTRKFTGSRTFVRSNVFTGSEKFAASASFSKSAVFAQSNTHSKSGVFSASLPMTLTQVMTNSAVFSASEKLADTAPFSMSNSFSESTSFSPSANFTPSDIFSHKMFDLGSTGGVLGGSTIGVIVAGVVVVIAIAGVAVFFVLRRRNVTDFSSTEDGSSAELDPEWVGYEPEYGVSDVTTLRNQISVLDIWDDGNFDDDFNLNNQRYYDARGMLHD